MKIGNYIMYNNNMKTDFIKAIMILCPYLYFGKLLCNKEIKII